MTLVAGMSALYHDSAVCVLRDGRVAAAAQEERFTRRRFEAAVPVNALKYCMDSTAASLDDLDLLAYYEDPGAKLRRILWSVENGHLPARVALRRWHEKTRTVDWIRHWTRFSGEVRCYPHHFCHAASSYCFSGFSDAALLIVDGVGEWATISEGVAEGTRIELREHTRFPHSLGLFYNAVTSFLGFAPNSDEYKVMGLAAYGRPTFADSLLKLVTNGTGGRLGVVPQLHAWADDAIATMLERATGIPPRSLGEEIKPVHADVAASIQHVLEECLMRLVRRLSRATRKRNLCLGGGVALNCAANGRIISSGCFDRVFVPPAPGDAGSSLGAAALAHQELSGRAVEPLVTALHGPSYQQSEIATLFGRLGVKFSILPRRKLLQRTAQALADGRTVGWFHGRMEFGPRALGARSILADPRNAAMRDKVNASIKFRESFRPFAPVCRKEDAHEYFDVQGDTRFMTTTVRVRKHESLRAVTHFDGTARLQTIDETSHPLLDALLREFGSITGVPVLLNTSFNVAGEPIVCTPWDAWSTFRESGLDVLVAEGVWVDREVQDPACVHPGTYQYQSIARQLSGEASSTYTFA
ncbi:carbamoyltransferase [Paraburkholderia mimosarum]|uniref:carbamoyltransferase family protein n=1 Tax=Paraburkholderia mimosarum TaxID=312026 RepID=UPI00040796EA|nr:carbamoyltransferase C-terminal domain-containing protein [Paraburkholderia mimosarum]